MTSVKPRAEARFGRFPDLTKGQRLEPLGAVWHLLNFFAPAAGIGFFASGLAKVLWRSEMRPVPWLRLFAVTSGIAAAVLVGGLLMLGRDGRVATYAAMVLASALSLWWFGLRPLRR